MNSNSINLRTCLLDPIPQIFAAAKHLDNAVTAHLAGDSKLAEKLIRLADMPEIYEWCESLWGAGGPFSRPLPVENQPPHLSEGERIVKRQAGELVKRALLVRDGFHCRFCSIPLVRGKIRNLIRSSYPEALRWDESNPGNHAAFQAMDLHYDHILPHARGGTNDPENMLVTCAPCNCGRMNLTLDEAGLYDPRLRQATRSQWDGLERFHP